MVRSCSAFNCTQKHERGISFHEFPKDPIRLKQWLMAMKRDEWTPSKYSVICSKHFISDCYEKSGWSSRATLKADAVPSKFSFPEPLSKEFISRLLPEKKKLPIPSSSLNLNDGSRTNPLDIVNEEVGVGEIKKKRLCYLGDFKDCEISEKESIFLQLLRDELKKKNAKIRSLQQKNRRLVKKVNDLESLVIHLKENQITSNEDMDFT